METKAEQDPEKFQRLVEQEIPSKWIALKNRLERVCFIKSKKS